MKRLKLVLLVLLLLTAIDQGTKEIARRTLRGEPTLRFWSDAFRLTYSENTGAFLSLGARMSDETRFWVFTVFVGVAMVALFVYTMRKREIPPLHLLALALILAGGTSNLLDRLFNDGAVVDFMNVGIGKLRTGIFNVADMAILAGVGILIFPARSVRPASEATSSAS